MSIHDVSPQDVLQSFQSLSKKDMVILTTIYHSPGCLLSSDELKMKLKILPTEIGRLGKKLGKLCGVTDFGTYKEGREYRPAYFAMIGDYTEAGWALRDSINKVNI